MSRGDGLWWLGLITQLVVLAVALGAVIYLGWINYRIKHPKRTSPEEQSR